MSLSNTSFEEGCIPPPTSLCALADQGVSVTLGSLSRTQRFPSDPSHTATWNQSPGGTEEAMLGQWKGIKSGNFYLIKELVKQLDVQEHGRGVSKLVGHHVEEHLGTEDVVLGAALTSL